MSLKRTILSLILFLICFIVTNKASATHERAGYIIWKHVYVPGAPWCYQATVVTFTKESSYLADRKYLTICWGDGHCDSIPRINYYIYPDNDIKENWYQSPIHSYSGPDVYQISMTDPNRIASIINIALGGSVNVALCLLDTMNILPPADFGYDNSPIILNPPIQFGAVGDTFIYNPDAYDPDGDSLSYQMTIPRQSNASPDSGGDVPYVPPTAIDPGPDNNYSFDTKTGTYTWATPAEAGIYNIAMIVSEWRKIYGKYYKNGSVEVDIQIIINPSNLSPPIIKPPRDTCVIAGASLYKVITAYDINNTIPRYPVYTPDTITASGTPFEVAQPATFFSYNEGLSDTAWGVFDWNTDCNDIRPQPYQVEFDAYNDYNGITLSDNVTWNITVVAPPVTGLNATTTGNEIILKWDSVYPCASATTFLGFTVWRANGCTNITPDTCNPTSVLAGYTELTQNPIRQYHYDDNSVLQGIGYSYIVVAEFGDSTYTGYFYNEVFSVSSNAVCAHLKKDVPIITNVSVVNTAAHDSGTMYVAWSRPSVDSNILDTMEYPGPYRYSYFRSKGSNGGNPMYLYSYTQPGFYLFTTTSFVDTGIDTKDNPYSYIIKFYSNYSDTDSVEIGTTNLASSIYLNLVGNNHIITLTWNENVPWINDSFQIYRQNFEQGLFQYVATTNLQAYTDKGLKNDSTYCYYVESFGHYSINGINSPLVDSSQINCTVPVDTTRPCAPTLTVTNDCNSNNNYGNFINKLQWQLNATACANSSILKFYIYYSPLENAPLRLIDSTQNATTLTYTSALSNTVAGCYAVASEDSGYTLSDLSNKVCVDNCPIYNLPNVFTPNGDEHNDEFTPFLPYQYIDHIDMHIYNRWGELVFETTDPMISWNGRSFNTGKECPDGVYYYTCDVYELTVNGVVKLNPSLKGYVQILR